MKFSTKFDYDSPDITIEELKKQISYKLLFIVGRDPAVATKEDWLVATMLATKDHMTEDWLRTRREQYVQDTKQICYLSMEFLIGRTLTNALIATGIYDEIKTALSELGVDLNEISEFEGDPGLGNGGLGRLAACFLDSLATQNYSAWGYGLRYEYGMFKQVILNNQQIEIPDSWLKHGNAWEFHRMDIQHTVRLGGRLQVEGDLVRWVDSEKVLACAYDLIIPGYGTDVTNTLRLWSSQAFDDIDLNKFNEGDYFAAIEKRSLSEGIAFVLYPNDSSTRGKALRLCQEFFLVSATIQDIVDRHYARHQTLDNLVDKISIHLNDTHPVLAIPELIRVLMDEYNYDWDKAWNVTKQIFSYTNHTLMAEALETWTVDMMSRVLPYHLNIIFKINYQFIQEVKQRFPNDGDLVSRVSIIDEEHGRRVRMAWLAVIASHKINGVSQLHSKLMTDDLFADFWRLYPERFCNKTNGVTPRRWLCVANPNLTAILDKYLDKSWRINLNMLSKLNEQVDNQVFLQELNDAKIKNKQRLVKYIADNLNIELNPEALFDMQVKRIHEYKRQGLNLLHAIVRYNEILKNPDADWVPRVVFFSGKAASSYTIAKQLIELINEVAIVINNDERIKGKLKIVFVPNYSVSIAEIMIPAADLSEQISLAGYEASGTSNMKFALNGSLIIGTADGANVEICESVGDENIFIFGHTSDEVKALRNHYSPREIYEKDERIYLALSQIANGHFSQGARNKYCNLFDSIIAYGDYYQNLADFDSYYNAQHRVDELYKDKMKWARCVAMNIANMGKFSSDNTIKEYADEIWNIKPLQLQ